MSLETIKVNFLDKLAVFSVKRGDLDDGFSGKKSLLAIWKTLLKITAVRTCYSMGNVNFKTQLQNAGVFEKYTWKPGIIHPGSAIWMLIWKPQKHSQKHIFLKRNLKKNYQIRYSVMNLIYITIDNLP